MDSITKNCKPTVDRSQKPDKARPAAELPKLGAPSYCALERTIDLDDGSERDNLGRLRRRIYSADYQVEFGYLGDSTVLHRVTITSAKLPAPVSYERPENSKQWICTSSRPQTLFHRDFRLDSSDCFAIRQPNQTFWTVRVPGADSRREVPFVFNALRQVDSAGRTVSVTLDSYHNGAPVFSANPPLKNGELISALESAAKSGYGLAHFSAEGGVDVYRLHKGAQWINPPIRIERRSENREAALAEQVARVLNEPALTLRSPRKSSINTAARFDPVLDRDVISALQPLASGNVQLVLLSGNEHSLRYQFVQSGRQASRSIISEKAIGEVIEVPLGADFNERNRRIVSAVASIREQIPFEIETVLPGARPLAVKPAANRELWELLHRAKANDITVRMLASGEFQLLTKGNTVPGTVLPAAESDLFAALQKRLELQLEHPPVAIESQLHGIAIQAVGVESERYPVFKQASALGLSVALVSVKPAAGGTEALQFQIYTKVPDSDLPMAVGTPITVTRGAGTGSSDYYARRDRLLADALSGHMKEPPIIVRSLQTGTTAQPFSHDDAGYDVVKRAKEGNLEIVLSEVHARDGKTPKSDAEGERSVFQVYHKQTAVDGSPQFHVVGGLIAVPGGQKRPHARNALIEQALRTQLEFPPLVIKSEVFGETAAPIDIQQNPELYRYLAGAKEEGQEVILDRVVARGEQRYFHYKVSSEFGVASAAPLVIVSGGKEQIQERNVALERRFNLQRSSGVPPIVIHNDERAGAVEPITINSDATPQVRHILREALADKYELVYQGRVTPDGTHAFLFRGSGKYAESGGRLPFIFLRDEEFQGDPQERSLILAQRAAAIFDQHFLSHSSAAPTLDSSKLDHSKATAKALEHLLQEIERTHPKYLLELKRAGQFDSFRAGLSAELVERRNEFGKRVLFGPNQKLIIHLGPGSQFPEGPARRLADRFGMPIDTIRKGYYANRTGPGAGLLEDIRRASADRDSKVDEATGEVRRPEYVIFNSSHGNTTGFQAADRWVNYKDVALAFLEPQIGQGRKEIDLGHINFVDDCCYQYNNVKNIAREMFSKELQLQAQNLGVKIKNMPAIITGAQPGMLSYTVMDNTMTHGMGTVLQNRIEDAAKAGVKTFTFADLYVVDQQMAADRARGHGTPDPAVFSSRPIELGELINGAIRRAGRTIPRPAAGSSFGQRALDELASIEPLAVVDVRTV